VIDVDKKNIYKEVTIKYDSVFFLDYVALSVKRRY